MTAVLTLLDISTNFESKKQIIDLMLKAADDMSENKTFGKLLISIVKTIGKHLKQVEPSIQQIINKHKTAFKVKAENELNKFNDSFALSQSLLY